MTRHEALAAWPAVWDAVRGQRAGLHTRSAAWCVEERGVPAQEREEAGWSKDFLVSLEEDGATIGYARYRVRGEWEHGLPAGEVAVHELPGIDGGAEAALWEYVLGVDLVDRVTAHRRPLDDTLLHLLEDPRRAVRRPSDALFCRVLDPAAALEGRRYAGEGRLVLEAADDFGGYAAGRFALEAGPAGARCRVTGESADLELGAEELGSLLFGQVSALDALAGDGRIVGQRGRIGPGGRCALPLAAGAVGPGGLVRTVSRGRLRSRRRRLARGADDGGVELRAVEDAPGDPLDIVGGDGFDGGDDLVDGFRRGLS
ncbi:sterol carrier protein domain-containing protein [Tepidiforma flava]|uniref:Sterol carrier protein domain-containing protein n=1 Tax=Tepidiforma flava TaxID=3004094 RepID=A0ABY7M3S4_9CHLR|nr:sterol carrier protein domain-containing protein [Tepidiforma flava]WBL34982.1 sterol carrier protein domain-containing protein [Tepidiforma flava]